VRSSRRIPGIIGGAGPAATAQLYLDIVSRCRQAGLARRPPILIASLDIDLAVEARLLREGVGIEDYWDPLLAAARSLTAAGADFLAIPCNTLHVLLPELQQAVATPVLSIVDAVAREVDRVGCETVGLLSTSTTAGAGLYENGLQQRGIAVVGIPADLQAALDQRIEAELEQPNGGGTGGLDARIMDYFASRGAGAVIAGCTELKAMMSGWEIRLPVIDSLDALGAAVAQDMIAGGDQTAARATRP
jgi:aspartate racemase